MTSINNSSRVRIAKSLEAFFSSLSQEWAQATLTSNRERGLTVETRQVSEGAKRLPMTGRLLRGLSGADLVENRPPDPLFQDIIPNGHGSIPAWEVRRGLAWYEVWSDVQKALLSAVGLRTRLLVQNFGWPKAQERLKARPTWPNDYEDYADYVEGSSAMSAFSECLARYLTDKGYSPKDFRKLELGGAEAQEFGEFLWQASALESVRYEILAVLNSPPADNLDPQMIWCGQFHERPCKLTVMYPSDQLLSLALREAGYPSLPPHSSVGSANLAIRLEYELVWKIPDENADDAHYDASEILRQAIDCLRLVCDEDVGILCLVARSQSPLAPSPRWLFPEHPNGSYDRPLRRKYGSPRTDPLTDAERNLWIRLFLVYRGEYLKVGGLPVAMNCFREVYERYAIDDPLRLILVVAAFESLYLSDGARDEIALRLRLRSAKFLGDTLEDRVAVYTKVGECYAARSKIVHGARLKGRDADRLETLCGEGLALLRKTIRKFLEGDSAFRERFLTSDFWRDLVLR